MPMNARGLMPETVRSNLLPNCLAVGRGGTGARRCRMLLKYSRAGCSNSASSAIHVAVPARASSHAAFSIPRQWQLAMHPVHILIYNTWMFGLHKNAVPFNKEMDNLLLAVLLRIRIANELLMVCTTKE